MPATHRGSNLSRPNAELNKQKKYNRLFKNGVGIPYNIPRFFTMKRVSAKIFCSHIIPLNFLLLHKRNYSIDIDINKDNDKEFNLIKIK